MHQLGVTLLAAFAGAGTLLMFYAAVRTEWPSNYVSIDADYGVIINRSFWRYTLFTFAPTYLVSLFSTTLCVRFDGHGAACALLIALAHILKNNGRHAFLVMRYRRDQARYPLLIVDFFNIGVVFVAALAGAAGPGPFPDVVPAASEFFSSLWTTAFVAIVGVFLLNATRNRTTLDKLLRRSQTETRDLTPLALALANEHGADAALVLAIMYTENLQRPRWVRALERIKGKIWPRGTYGVMQVSSCWPLSDEESVRKAIIERLSGISLPPGEPTFDYNRLEEILRKWNDNDEFVNLARNLYYYLYADYRLQPDEYSPSDGENNTGQTGLDDGGSAAPEDVDAAQMRARLAVTLRVLVRSIPDDSALTRISTALSLDTLQALVTALGAVSFLPTDDDVRFGNELYESLSGPGLRVQDDTAGTAPPLVEGGAIGTDEFDGEA